MAASSSVTANSPAAPSSPYQHNPVPMGLQSCIERTKQVAKEFNARIFSGEDEEFRCPVSLLTMRNPVVVLPCRHTFEQESIQRWVDQALPQDPLCPLCRTLIFTPIPPPDISIQERIEEASQKEQILTLSDFKEENKERAESHLKAAETCMANKDYVAALEAYRDAFKHTNRSEDYAQLPLLYQQLEQPEKAALAYLYLGLYQLQEGKTQEAYRTLCDCATVIVSPEQSQIEALRMSLLLSLNPDQNQINEILEVAAKQVDSQEAIAIYKQVIAYDPLQFEAYKPLCALLRSPAEKRHFLLKAAEHAESKDQVELALDFRAQAETPIYPTSITQEDWAHPAEFMKRLPPYPQAMVDFLEGPCPNNPGRLAKDTHVVAPSFRNITGMVAGSQVTVPCTLAALDALDKTSGGVGCHYIWDEILTSGLDVPQEEDFKWLVMTKDVLPGSRHKSYADQQRLAEDKGYQVPGFRDAVLCTLLENRRSGNRLYGTEPITYTRCHEKIRNYQLVVGGFAPGGLRVNFSCYDRGNFGFAGLREF